MAQDALHPRAATGYQGTDCRDKSALMFAFTAMPNGWLTCQADFLSDPFLNLDFIDLEHDLIPFHLSLRQQEGLVVVNRRHAAGWRRELSWPFAFGDAPVTVDLRFGALGATLALNGRRIGRFDMLPRPSRGGRFLMRHGFPGLNRISHLRIEGGMQPGSLRLHRSLPSQASAEPLTDRLELTIDAPRAAAGRRLHLHLLPATSPDEPSTDIAADSPLPPEALSDPIAWLRAAGPGLPSHVVLPGWIWAEGQDRLQIATTTTEGNSIGRVTIAHADLLTALERAATNGIWAWDMLAALNAIEHVHYAGIMHQLSAPTRAALWTASLQHQLSDWLPASHQPAASAPPRDRPDTAPAAPDGQTGADARPADADVSKPGPKPQHPPPDPIEETRLAVLNAIRSAKADPLAAARQGMTAAGLSLEDRQTLARVLVEPFCRIDRMPELATLARDSGALPLPEYTETWQHTTALPYDVAQGWYEAIAGRLDYLAATAAHEDWAVTEAIAWTVSAMLDARPGLNGQRPDAAEMEAVVENYLKYLEALQPHYWSRSPCRALMAPMLRILCCPELVPQRLWRDCVQGAVALWGLSPGFWEALERKGVTAMPGILAEAQEICAALIAAAQSPDKQAPDKDRAQIDRLLRRAEALGMADTLRFRIDLLGPSALPGGRPDLQELGQRGLWPEEICLRALVHPDMHPLPPPAPEAQPALPAPSVPSVPAPQPGAAPSEPAVPPAVVAAAAGGLVSAYPELPSHPQHALERRLVAQARTLARALARAPETAALQGWATALSPLSGAASGHGGITLALGLAASLVANGQRAAAEALLATPLLSHPAERGADRQEPRGPAQALAVLARHDVELAQRAACALDLPEARDRLSVAAPPARLAQAGNPLHDTLVAIYSCRAHLDNRIYELRQAWLQDLTAMGIPWLIFTGGGKGRRVGDVVHLDAPDDYEGLPDKTLAMVRWVLDKTPVSRLLKVDDDCFLHAEAWFGDLAHLRHDYYGRALTLMPGQMNRRWHMAKSRSRRGRLGLDKSPEPARYADGGSGYMLSRHAMEKLTEAAESAEGIALRQSSFMEDKLTGALLALRGIKVSDEDYRTAVLRRSVPGGPAIPAWENGVLPFRGSPVKLVHLDDSLPQRRTHALSRRAAPQPGKIWPSYQPPRSGSRSNTLDLLSPPSRLARLRDVPVAVVACLRNEATILPAFLDHYRKLGVEGFLIADNGSTDGTLELLAKAPDVALFAVDTEYGASQYGVAWQQALLANYRVGKWSLLADADEFLTWSNDPAARIADLLASPGFAHADAARVLMLDMYPRGPLAQVTLATGDPFAETGYCERQPFLRNTDARGPYTDTETLTSALRHRLIPGSRPELFVAQKLALLRYQPWMRLSAGLHYVAETRTAPQDLLFAHFKYTAAFHQKVQQEVQRRQHFNDAEEYRAYLALLAEGQEVIFDPATSVPWQDCDEVRRIFATHATAARHHRRPA